MTSDNISLDPKLLAKLRSKKEAERAEAQATLRSLGPGAVDALLGLLDKEAITRQKRKKIGIAVIAFYVLMVVFLMATGHAKNIGSIGGMTGILATLFAATQAQKDAAGALSGYDDKRGVGRLAEALEFQDKRTHADIEAALIRLLPQLTASDHALLSPEQRRCLDRAIVKRKQGKLAMAVLDAYEQVGDRDSVSVVERMAEGKVRGLEPAVAARAAEVLPAMRNAAELVAAAQTLLRPADSVADDMLLRPALGAPTGPAETLLRPADLDEETPQPTDQDVEQANTQPA
jgi:hypothetical protein